MAASDGVAAVPAALARWLGALPLALYVVAFLGYPVVHALGLALTDPAGDRFPSLVNLRTLAGDALFWRALLNNLVLPVASVALELVLGLGLALLLAALPEIVYLTVMRYVLAPRGYANAALAAAGLESVDWLLPGRWRTLAVVAVVDAWHVTPVVFLLLLAALAAMPAGIHEAARLDGAGAWARFRRVTLPLLAPALATAALLRGLDAVRIFAAPLVLAGVEGLPVLSTYAFHQWSDYGDDGAAAAAALVLALTSVVLAASLLRRRA
jgi:multiple sugar transport system permease protein